MRVKVTVEVSPYLLEEAKDAAAESGRSLDDVISDALCESLNARRARKQQVREEVKLPTFGGGGVLPGVDLTSNAALEDLIESERDSERRKHFAPRVPAGGK